MTVCMLLAAGSSSRMGAPKMLLPFGDSTLLQHVINQAQKVKDTELIVVTGSYHSILEPLLAAQQIPCVENKNWQHGMGTSVQTGIRYIRQKYPDALQVLILVCDQPFVTAALFREIIATAHQTQKGIVACAYSGTRGTPVCFSKKYFPVLLQLPAEAGAKKIILQYPDDVALVSFEKGSVDIDTPNDYKNYHSILPG